MDIVILYLEFALDLLWAAIFFEWEYQIFSCHWVCDLQCWIWIACSL